MNDYIIGRLPHSFGYLFRFNFDIQEAYLTRQSSLIKIERCDSAFSAKFPIYKFQYIWNKWTSIVRNFTSKCQFKSEIKRKNYYFLMQLRLDAPIHFAMTFDIDKKMFISLSFRNLVTGIL